MVYDIPVAVEGYVSMKATAEVLQNHGDHTCFTEDVEGGEVPRKPTNCLKRCCDEVIT
jgi:hypothetical protein